MGIPLKWMLMSCNGNPGPSLHSSAVIDRNPGITSTLGTYMTDAGKRQVCCTDEISRFRCVCVGALPLHRGASGVDIKLNGHGGSSNWTAATCTKSPHS